MGLNLGRVARAAPLVLAVAAVGAAVDGWRWWQLRQENAHIAAATAAEPPAGASAQWRLAHALALAAAGQGDAALRRLGALYGDAQVGRAARYDAANLLLRQAQALHEAGQLGQALAWVELAKEQYREVLRQEPGHWDARYNLERAVRLAPEADAADDEPPEARRNAERAATTMRGYSPGLP